MNSPVQQILERVRAASSENAELSGTFLLSIKEEVHAGNANVIREVLHALIETDTESYKELLLSISDEPPTGYKVLLESMSDFLRNDTCPNEKRCRVLCLFQLFVAERAKWLHHAVKHTFFATLLKILKTENDVRLLVPALLSCTALLTMRADIMTDLVTTNLLPILWRLAQLLTASKTSKSNEATSVHSLMLATANYTLFLRLYALFPANTVEFLKREFAKSRENQTVYDAVFRVYFARVRYHPALIADSKNLELDPHRWTSSSRTSSKGAQSSANVKKPSCANLLENGHEVMFECASYSLDFAEGAFLQLTPSGPSTYRSAAPTTSCIHRFDPTPAAFVAFGPLSTSPAPSPAPSFDQPGRPKADSDTTGSSAAAHSQIRQRHVSDVFKRRSCTAGVVCNHGHSAVATRICRSHSQSPLTVACCSCSVPPSPCTITALKPASNDALTSANTIRNAGQRPTTEVDAPPRPRCVVNLKTALDAAATTSPAAPPTSQVLPSIPPLSIPIVDDAEPEPEPEIASAFSVRLERVKARRDRLSTWNAFQTPGQNDDSLSHVRADLRTHIAKLSDALRSLDQAPSNCPPPAPGPVPPDAHNAETDQNETVRTLERARVRLRQIVPRARSWPETRKTRKDGLLGDAHSRSRNRETKPRAETARTKEPADAPPSGQQPLTTQPAAQRKCAPLPQSHTQMLPPIDGRECETVPTTPTWRCSTSGAPSASSSCHIAARGSADQVHSRFIPAPPATTAFAFDALPTERDSGCPHADSRASRSPVPFSNGCNCPSPAELRPVTSWFRPLACADCDADADPGAECDAEFAVDTLPRCLTAKAADWLSELLGEHRRLAEFKVHLATVRTFQTDSAPHKPKASAASRPATAEHNVLLAELDAHRATVQLLTSQLLYERGCRNEYVRKVADLNTALNRARMFELAASDRQHDLDAYRTVFCQREAECAKLREKLCNAQSERKCAIDELNRKAIELADARSAHAKQLADLTAQLERSRLAEATSARERDECCARRMELEHELTQLKLHLSSLTECKEQNTDLRMQLSRVDSERNGILARYRNLERESMQLRAAARARIERISECSDDAPRQADDHYDELRRCTLRLETDNNRLEQELASLRELLKAKDAAVTALRNTVAAQQRADAEKLRALELRCAAQSRIDGLHTLQRLALSIIPNHPATRSDDPPEELHVPGSPELNPRHSSAAVAMPATRVDSRSTPSTSNSLVGHIELGSSVGSMARTCSGAAMPMFIQRGGERSNRDDDGCINRVRCSSSFADPLSASLAEEVQTENWEMRELAQSAQTQSQLLASTEIHARLAPRSNELAKSNQPNDALPTGCAGASVE